MQIAICSAQGKFEISITNDLVSLDADKADLKLVLQQLSAQSGIKLWIAKSLQPQQVSLHFEKQTMEEALRRLLEDDSYALVYDDNAVVTALYVLPPGEAALPATVKLMPQNDDNRQQLFRDALESSLVPDNIKSALMNQFGENSEALEQSVPLQRSNALETLIQTVQQFGSANSETIRLLREKLELDNTEQQNQ